MPGRPLIGLAAVCLLVAAGAAPARPSAPLPLSGVPLGSSSGLHLLVAAVPPFVLDVDSGRVRRVRGVRTELLSALSVTGVGGRSAIVDGHTGAPNAPLYSVRGTNARVAGIGAGSTFWPSADGRAAWIQSRNGSRCTLRRVTLDGRTTRRPHRFPCTTGAGSAAASRLGLVAGPSRVVDPLTGRAVYRTAQRIVAVAGRRVLLGRWYDRPFTLVDTETGSQRPVPWPSDLAGLDAPAADLQGRYVALAFANPSRTTEAGQAFDVSVLDTATGKTTRLPGMPTFLALKGTSMAWTRDGRLVLLAEQAGKNVVAVWRPGRQRLAVKIVRLPDRTASGSDSFTLLQD